MGKLSTGIWNYTKTAALIGTGAGTGLIAGQYVSDPTERGQTIGGYSGAIAGAGIALGMRGLGRAGKRFFGKDPVAAAVESEK